MMPAAHAALCSPAHKWPATTALVLVAASAQPLCSLSHRNRRRAALPCHRAPIDPTPSRS